MNQLQKLQIEQSEIREKLNALLGIEDRSAEQDAELEALTQRGQSIEPEIRAALVAQGEPPTTTTSTEDAKEREFRELRSSIRLSNYVAAAMDGRQVEGREAEFNQEVGMRAGGAFPLALLAPDPQVEQRTTTNVDSGQSQQTWVDRLFAQTAAAYLGITMRSVAPGVASFPVTTAGAAAAQLARAAAAGDAAWTIGTKDMKPTRNAVRAVFTEEDAMRLPGLEEALRRDLGMALAEGIDRAIFIGDTTAGEDVADQAGLVGITGVSEAEITQTNKTAAVATLTAFLGFIDGKHASMLSDLNCVLSVGAHNLWAATLVNSTTDNQTMMHFLKENGLSCMTRGDIETATDNGDWGAFVGRRRGLEGAGVAAIWDSGMLIRDPYSAAAKGEVGLTLSYYWDFGLPRASNFGRVKFVT